jgi:antitoxin HicB
MIKMKTTDETSVAQKDLRYYLALSYPMELHEDDGSYTALYPDLPGCMSYGDTPNDAVSALKRVKRLWISGRLESGMSIPEPTNLEDFSGKFLVRVPKSLHRDLHCRAQQEGVSLNQYVTHVLSSKTGSRGDEDVLSAAVQAVLTRIGQRIIDKNMYSSHPHKSWNIQSVDPNFAALNLLRHEHDTFDFQPAPFVFSKKPYVEVGCE